MPPNGNNENRKTSSRQSNNARFCAITQSISQTESSKFLPCPPDVVVFLNVFIYFYSVTVVCDVVLHCCSLWIAELMCLQRAVKTVHPIGACPRGDIRSRGTYSHLCTSISQVPSRVSFLPQAPQKAVVST